MEILVKVTIHTNGIRYFVKGTKIRSADPAAAAATTWECDNAKAMFLIASMEPSRLDLLPVCTMAKDMWEKLFTMHEQKAVANKMGFLQEFHEYRMRSNDSIEQDIEKCRTAILTDLSET